jgi:hypothetical protein
MIADVHRRNASCLESAHALWLVADGGNHAAQGLYRILLSLSAILLIN